MVIDSAGAVNLQGIPHVGLRELPDAVWRDGRSVAFHPESDSDAQAALEALHAARGVHVLVDESAFWVDSARGRGGVLERVARSARHYGMTLAMTSQYIGSDVSQQVMACAPEMAVFRSRSPRALRVLEDRYGLDQAQVAALENDTYMGGR